MEASSEGGKARSGSVVFKQGREETNARGTVWPAGRAGWHGQDRGRRDNKVGKDKTEAAENIEGGEQCEAQPAWNVMVVAGHGVRDKDCVRALLWW